MDHFHEGAGAEPIQQLAQLESKLAEVEAAHDDLLRSLANGHRQTADSLEQGLAIVAGEELPDRNDVQQLQADELRLREQISVLQQAVGKQRQLIELARARAGAELRRTHPKLKGIAATWEKGQALVREAMQAEDAVLSELGSLGYGSGEPMITRAHWINRGGFLTD